jgi:hypothetical protein
MATDAAAARQSWDWAVLMTTMFRSRAEVQATAPADLAARPDEPVQTWRCEVLGYVELERDEASIEIGPPGVGFGGPQPTIVLSQTDEPKAGRLRLHIDVNATDREQDDSWSGYSWPAPAESILGRPAPSHGTCSLTMKVTSSAY